jgi:hypothetical protein
LEQTTHDVEDGGLADAFGGIDLVVGKGSVGGGEVVALWCGDEGGDEADEIVVHVAGVAKGGGGGGHDGGDELVGLAEGGALHVELVLGDAVEGGVVEDDDRVGVLGEAAKGEEGVVGLDDDVALASIVVGEDRVGLYKLLGEAVIKLLEEVAAEATAGTAGDRVEEHKALKGIATIRLAVKDVENVFAEGGASGMTLGPVVAGATAILGDKDVLRIIEVGVGGGGDAVDDAGLEVEEDGAGDVVLVVSLVKKDILAVAALGGKVLEGAVAGDAVFRAEFLPEFVSDCCVVSCCVALCCVVLRCVVL